LLLKPLQQRSFVNKQATTDARHAWNLMELDSSIQVQAQTPNVLAHLRHLFNSLMDLHNC